MNKIKVLIADDSDVIRLLTVNKLNKLFSDVDYDLVEDGKNALYSITNKEYDIVILDNIMPEMNGYEVLYKGLSKLRETVKVLCTGDEDDELKALNKGFDVYIRKPLQEDSFNILTQQLSTKSKFKDVTWIEESHELCNELRPKEKDKLLIEICDSLKNIIFCISDKKIYKDFHHIKGLLSYFNDELMDEAAYFERVTQRNDDGVKFGNSRLKDFIRSVKKLANYKKGDENENK